MQQNLLAQRLAIVSPEQFQENLDSVKRQHGHKIPEDLLNKVLGQAGRLYAVDAFISKTLTDLLPLCTDAIRQPMIALYDTYVDLNRTFAKVFASFYHTTSQMMHLLPFFMTFNPEQQKELVGKYQGVMIGAKDVDKEVSRFIGQMKSIMESIINVVGHEQIANLQKQKQDLKDLILQLETEVSETASQVTYWTVKHGHAELAVKDAVAGKKYFENQRAEIEAHIRQLRAKEEYLQGVVGQKVGSTTTSSGSSSSSSYNRGPWWTLWTSRCSSSSSSYSNTNSTSYDLSNVHKELARIRDMVAEQQNLLTQTIANIMKSPDRSDVETAAKNKTFHIEELPKKKARHEHAQLEFKKITAQLEEEYRKKGTDSVKILQGIEQVGSAFVQSTGRLIQDMVSQAEFASFKLSFEKPTILSIIPMLISGIEYGDLYNLSSAQPISFMINPVFLQLETIKTTATQGMNTAVLVGDRPCIKDKPEPPPAALDLF